MKMLVKGINGANGVKQTTYAALLALRNASNLIPLQKYAFEFRTYHKIPDIDPVEYYTGPTETLVVEAISVTELNPLVVSLDHPDDTIWYELVSTNTYDTGVSFDRGRIIRRMVSKHGIDIGADFRGMKFKRRQLFTKLGISGPNGFDMTATLIPTQYYPGNHSVCGQEFSNDYTWELTVSAGYIVSYKYGVAGNVIEAAAEFTQGVPYELKDESLNGTGLFVTLNADVEGVHYISAQSAGFLGFVDTALDNGCPNYLNHYIKGYDTALKPIIPLAYDPANFVGINIGECGPTQLIDTVILDNSGDPTHFSVEVADYCSKISIGSGVAAIDIKPYNNLLIIGSGCQKVRVDYSNGNNVVKASQVTLGCCIDGTCVADCGEDITVLGASCYVTGNGNGGGETTERAYIGQGMNATSVIDQGYVVVTPVGSNLETTLAPVDGELTLADPCREGIVFISSNSPITSIVNLPNWDIELRSTDAGTFFLTTPTALADVAANNLLVDTINGVSWDYYKSAEAFCVIRKQTITNVHGTFVIARVIRSFGGTAD